MRLPLFQLDAFTTRRFAGNPAAVMPLESFLPDATLQAIAAENNLAETAFLVAQAGDYLLRWFTPTAEVALCGHATLASAAVVMEKLEPTRREVVFHTASGPLPVRRAAGDAAGRYVMSFPARPAQPVALPSGMVEAIGAEPVQFLADAVNYIAVLESAQAVRRLTPDIPAIARLAGHGLIVTAADEPPYDFVSRFFAPAIGVPEDPVTGSAHCALIPHWAEQLGKSEFLAYQASRRGGEITCRLTPSGVELEGTCVFYLEGYAEI